MKSRIATNLRTDKPPISKGEFWDRMVGCLLTTQQRSGPGSTVAKFLRTKPLPLNYPICAKQDDLAEFTRAVLSNFGGVRRSTIIGKELAANMSFLRDGGWEPTLRQLDDLRTNSSPETEKRAAAFIADSFKGFGPKQSRNLLQALGLSRFEIPIDSRITKWLNTIGFPVKLTANALQDRNYYNFVSDGFQKLCEACDITPCVLDAVIFSSFDEGKWTEENVV
ncbi:MAG: hypothetical protein HKN37_11130 [Rhodothermales bacterium]|nr:hypothetical protein [Rhodothermales bacterium]